MIEPKPWETGKWSHPGDSTMEHPLSDMEVASFREYAIENRTEPEGTQCQWADYTIRVLDELVALRAKCEESLDEIDHLRAQLTRCQEENTREVERRRKAARSRDHWLDQADALRHERDELKARLGEAQDAR